MYGNLVGIFVIKLTQRNGKRLEASNTKFNLLRTVFDDGNYEGITCVGVECCAGSYERHFSF